MEMRIGRSGHLGNSAKGKRGGVVRPKGDAS